MLGSAELVELAEAARRACAVRRAAPYPAPMAADAGAAGYGGAGLHPLSSLQEELQCVLPEGTRLIDSGAAIARRTAAVRA